MSIDDTNLGQPTVDYQTFFDQAIPALQAHLGLDSQYALPVQESGLAAAFFAYYMIRWEDEEEFKRAGNMLYEILRNHTRHGGRGRWGYVYPKSYTGQFLTGHPNPALSLANVRTYTHII